MRVSAGVDTRVRRAIRVQGLVQGVGFRPFVYRLAVRHGLAGFVRNETGRVFIEVEGDAPALDTFVRDLKDSPPPNARIGRLSFESRAPLGDREFAIRPSLDGAEAPSISPDVATCAECLREVLDPSDRRHRYAFTNCTDCGPRFTVVRSAPYDRERTSMDAFPLCSACRAEYEDPGDRRHHAEATACPTCGPRLGLTTEEAGVQVREGKILAVKGLGGFHLACDAGNEAAVRELRRRKGRDEKPFAVMVADPAAARKLCQVSPEEEDLLLTPARPIVLLRRRADAPVAESVAPGHPTLGIMLPYTPLHHLLLAELGGRPLVLTSGNVSDEPIAYRDGDALRDLGKIADSFLTHDREILVRCDDSVARVMAGEAVLLRRSRGYAPAPLGLPFRCAEPILALGGALKSVFALGRDREAILSHHLGDLEPYDSWRAYVAAIGHYERLFHFAPAVVAHDLHPDYPSTRYALERTGVRRVAVQHHHAHMAACMAEHGLEGPVIGVAFDGTGYGTDGAVWGGEFLVGDYRGFRRAAHFEYVPMPGGEAAIREPWRMAVAYLAHAGERVDLPMIPERSLEIVRRLDGPRTSSCGRLFDGVSALLGVRERVSYEGQAAIELETLARAGTATGPYPVEFDREGRIRLAPLISALVADLRRGTARCDLARRFHSTIVEAIRRTCARLRDETGLDRVVLSGGVFMNEIVLTEAGAALEGAGFRVHRHRLVPPNDGGLCLGQLAVAAAGGGL